MILSVFGISFPNWDFNGAKDYFEVVFRKKISTRPWKIFDQADTGPYTILYGKINGAKVNFTTGHRSFPGPVFP